MEDTLLLLFIFGFRLTSCSPTLPVIHDYQYVAQPMTWADAQNYCRVHYSDLATFESRDDIGRLNRPSSFTSLVWFGLTDDPKSWRSNMGTDSNSWRWSATGETSKTGYRNWNVYQPNDYKPHMACVIAYANGRWADATCFNKYSFVCYNDTVPPGQKTYYFIQTEVIWKDAQTYCRTHHTDLAVIETAEENSEVKSVLKGDAWIGLYRVLWRWSDNSNSTFRNWQSGQPNQYGGQYCAVEDSNHRWNDVRCDEKHSFVCQRQRDLKMKMTVLMKIQSDADLSDPASSNQILQQLHALLTNSSTKINFNLMWKTRPRKQEADDGDQQIKCL